MSDDGMHFGFELRTLAHVPRWGIARVLRRQSVAEHSYFTAVYAWRIAVALKFSPANIASVMTRALLHDLEEVFTTDIPGPVKRGIVNESHYEEYVGNLLQARFGNVSQLFTTTDWEGTVFTPVIKVANLLDEATYLTGEQLMGNHTIVTMKEYVLNRMREMVKSSGWSDDDQAEVYTQVILPTLMSEERIVTADVIQG